MAYKKGDLVKVYSLQSFFHGGFLNGEVGVVYQDQVGSSVLVTVNRNMGNMEYRLDYSYEVYEKQLELIVSFDNLSKTDKNKLNKILLETNQNDYPHRRAEEDFQIKYTKLMIRLEKKYDIE